MNGLIIEDDDLKLSRLKTFLRSVPGIADIECAKSYKSGLKALMAREWSVVILDMTLPTFDIHRASDGGRPLNLGGRELLRQMKRRGAKYPTAVVTGFDTFGLGREAVTLQQLGDQLDREFHAFYLGSVYFSATSEDWKDRLRELVVLALQKSGSGE